MAAGTAMGISLTTITTDLQCPLGFIHTEPANTDHAGERQFIYVSIVFGGGVAGADVAIGNILGHLTGAEASYADLNLAVTALNAPPGTIVGASQQAWTWADHYPSGAGAADALFGFIQCTGVGSVLGDAGMLVDQGVIASAAAGVATGTAAATDASFGLASDMGAGLVDTRLYCTG